MNPLIDFKEKTKYELEPTTMLRYSQAIEGFLVYTKKEVKFNKEDVTNYINHLKEKGFSGSYCNYIFQVLKTFYKKLGYQWLFEKKEAPRKSEPNQPILTLEQANKILELAKGNLRDYTILNLYFYSGMRRSEMLNLRRTDYVNNIIRIQTRKHNLTRHIEIKNKELNELLQTYINSLPKDQVTLFPLNTVYLSNVFRKYADAIGIPKKVGIHSIRRAVVTWLYNEDMDIIELQKFMGWKSSEMPSVYIQLDNKKLNDKVSQKHPLFRR